MIEVSPIGGNFVKVISKGCDKEFTKKRKKGGFKSVKTNKITPILTLLRFNKKAI